MDIPIKENGARARKAEADGEATYIEQTGRARGAEIEAVGLARARGFEAQSQAIGAEATASVNVVTELVKSRSRFVPDILVTGNGADATSAGALVYWAASCANSSDTGPRDRTRCPVRRRSRARAESTPAARAVWRVRSASTSRLRRPETRRCATCRRQAWVPLRSQTYNSLRHPGRIAALRSVFRESWTAGSGGMSPRTSRAKTARGTVRFRAARFADS